MCPSAAPPQLIRTRGTQQVTTLHLVTWQPQLWGGKAFMTYIVCRLRYEDLKMTLDMSIRYLHIITLHFTFHSARHWISYNANITWYGVQYYISHKS